jgi:hypothetical protein
VRSISAGGRPAWTAARLTGAKKSGALTRLGRGAHLAGARSHDEPGAGRQHAEGQLGQPAVALYGAGHFIPFLTPQPVSFRLRFGTSGFARGGVCDRELLCRPILDVKRHRL